MIRLRFVFRAFLVCLAVPSTLGFAQVSFQDVTKQSGIQFVHNNGARGKKYLPETMGPGCAFIDYDNDGFQDVLIVNGKDWTPSGRSSMLKLYHNNGNGTFTDVTARSGLADPKKRQSETNGDFD